MTDINIFEKATREKLRFPSVIGDLTTEQLWDLPLTERRADRADLDKIWRDVVTEFKSIDDEISIVDEAKPNVRKTLLAFQIEVLRHIIEVKKNDKKIEAKRNENAKTRTKLLDALAAKKDQRLAQMTEDEIKAELDKLGADA